MPGKYKWRSLDDPGLAYRPLGEPASERVQSGAVPRSSDNVEAAFVRSLSRGQEKPTNHAWRHRGLPDPRMRARCSPEMSHALRHSALDRSRGSRPPPGKAQAACCRLCVAPRTLSFRSSSGMRGLVSSIQSHGALGKNRVRPQRLPTQPQLPPCGDDRRDSWAVSRHPHLRQKRIHTQISREMIKSRFLLTATLSAHGGSLYLGEKKIISSAVSTPHILEPRSCKILAFSLGSLVVPYGVLCSSLETTQRNSAWSSLP